MLIVLTKYKKFLFFGRNFTCIFIKHIKNSNKDCMAETISRVQGCKATCRRVFNKTHWSPLQKIN